MDEAEWLRSGDVPRMLRALRSVWPGSEEDLNRRLNSYYLACCRRIWRLLPGDAIRMALDAAERHLDGRATEKELADLSYLAEGEMTYLYSDSDDPDHDCLWYSGRWLEEIACIPPNKLRNLVLSPPGSPELSPIEILRDAGGFAFSVVHYQSSNWSEPRDYYVKFLSAHLLREHFGNPFSSKPR